MNQLIFTLAFLNLFAMLTSQRKERKGSKNPTASRTTGLSLTCQREQVGFFKVSASYTGKDFTYEIHEKSFINLIQFKNCFKFLLLRAPFVGSS